MRRGIHVGRWLIAAALAASSVTVLPGIVHAQGNVQEGDNSSDTEQSGDAGSGDAVAGQVAGVVSGGSASVDGTNSTADSDATSGDARAANLSGTVVGPTVVGNCGQTADCLSADMLNFLPADNLQEGDNSGDTDQNANASTGDAVAGEVIGVVTSAGGSADVVLANSSLDSDAETGDSSFFNLSGQRVGLFSALGVCCPVPTDVLGADVASSIGV
jgi:hypothetical protein